MREVNDIYLKSECCHCHNPIEYPGELRGESIECPHCGQFTLLGNSSLGVPVNIQKSSPHPIPLSIVSARPVVQISSTDPREVIHGKKKMADPIGFGVILQVIGVLFLFACHWLALLAGITLIIVGGIMARKKRCSNCGSIVYRRARMCPICQCKFTN